MTRNLINFAILITLIFSSLSAQESLMLDHTIGSDFHRYEWFDYEKYDYTTDSEGRIIEKVFFVQGNEELVEQYKNEYIYDQNGNLAEEIEYVKGEDDWSPYKKTQNTYYPNDLISEKVFSSWVGDSWQATYRHLYNYDQDGNPIDIIEGAKQGDGWKNLVRNLSEYDGGLLIRETKKEWRQDEWKNIDKREYQYNESGFKKNVHLYFWSDENWVIVNKDLFKYNENNKLINATYYIYNGEEEIILETIDYSYFDNDSLKSKYHILEPDNRNDIHKTDFYYIPQENTRIEILMYQKYHDWIMNQKKVYIYNKNGHLKNEENYGWSQSRWIDNWKRVITYDQNGYIDVDNSYLYQGIGFGKSDSVKNHYKTGGLLDKQEYFRWDYGKWKKYKERIFYFDDDELSKEIITNFLDSDNISHSIMNKYDYNNDILSQEKIMKLQDGIWSDSLRIVFSHKNDILDNITELQWDGEMWKYKKRSIYVYNENDMISYKKEQYSAGTDVWIDHIFNYYYYDEDDKLKEILQEFSDNPGYQKKREYVYNENGMISQIKYSEKNNDWSPTNTHYFEYDENSNLVKEYEVSKSSTIYKQKDYYYDWINSVKKFDSGSAAFQVYPNPFTNELNVSFYLSSSESISAGIYDTSGRQVVLPISGNYSFGENKISFSTDFLPSGVYYFVLEIGNNTFTKKITSVK
jgi:hypothetical protein